MISRPLTFPLRGARSRSLFRNLLALGLAAAMLIAGCGQSAPSPDHTKAPHRVPANAVAIVSQTPITSRSLARLLRIRRQGEPSTLASDRALSYLIEAQWVLQEAESEGINRSVLDQLVARQVDGPHPPPVTPVTRNERVFQTRVQIVAMALRRRHSRASGHIGSHEISRYFATHRSQFTVPAVQMTRMIVTHRRGTALRARAALKRARDWAMVARRFSTDSSAVNGGAYAIPADGSPTKLVRRAFAAPPGRLIGPLRAPPAAGRPLPTFYLFKVINTRPQRPQPIVAISGQIRQILIEKHRQRALRAFERSFKRRWRTRTLCAAAYLVPLCHNYEESHP